MQFVKVEARFRFKTKLFYLFNARAARELKLIFADHLLMYTSIQRVTQPTWKKNEKKTTDSGAVHWRSFKELVKRTVCKIMLELMKWTSVVLPSPRKQISVYPGPRSAINHSSCKQRLTLTADTKAIVARWHLMIVKRLAKYNINDILWIYSLI